MLPVDLQSLDPQREQFLILAPLEPFANGFLLFLIITQECHHLLVPFHLSPIPVTLLLGLLQIFAQLLLQFYKRTDL
jgi:hypothetical protein